jgi:hypothetical protein
MAFPIIPKKRSGATGSPTSLELGELAVNTQTAELFLGTDGNTVILLNPPTAAGTTATERTGDGTTTAFTFTGYNGTADGGYLVSVGGIDQPPSKYAVTSTAGGTITFVEAPTAGELISIRALVASSGGGGGGITELTGDVTASGTGSVAATLAAITTAQSEVGSATQIPILSIDAKGRVTALSSVEIRYALEFLIVAGGGGAGVYYSGGGGAGGLLSGSTFVEITTAYGIVIGAGGAGTSNTTSVGSVGSSGANSIALGLTALGGGGGGSRFAGASGGSGGGGGNTNTAGGAGTSGQGSSGGNGSGTNGTSPVCGGGGGGATQVGVTAVYNSIKGNGGAGNSSFSAWATVTSTGSSGAYAGGGGGGTGVFGSITSTSVGGVGGGGAGGANSGTVAGTAGLANTGGGAGGGGENASTTGVSGGSGIVILRYAGAQRGTGGTVVTSGGYTYHTFLTSGTFTA